MDVRFVRPYYRGGKLWCWLSNTGHWPDTGGAVPGGFSASATAVEQEGLRLPPVKLFKKGNWIKKFIQLFVLTFVWPISALETLRRRQRLYKLDRIDLIYS